MRVVFAEASYWIALINPRDRRHTNAVRAGAALGFDYRVVTSEMVLVETLNTLAGLGSHLRSSGVRMIQEITDDERSESVAQTPELFRRALALYRDRPDKAWSLTDCASFVIMEERRITDALTHDRHFEQGGYRTLLRD